MSSQTHAQTQQKGKLRGKPGEAVTAMKVHSFRLQSYCGTPAQAKTIVMTLPFEALVAVHGYAFSLAEPARVYRAHGMQASR